jgi:hydrogenase-4 component E
VSLEMFARLVSLASSLVLLSGISILWRHSLPAYIRTFARQSFLFVLTILLVAAQVADVRLYVVAALVFVIKTLFIPRLLYRVQRHVGADIEVHPFINTPMSLLLAGLLTLLSYAIASPVVGLGTLPTRGGIPLALATVFVGLLIIVSRRSALTQIVGFLVLENGIALLAVLTTFGVPLMVELGVFLDVLLGVLVMQVFVYRIREAFDTIDVDRLKQLRH